MNAQASPVSDDDSRTETSTLLASRPLTAAEVSELWEFLHGDIMVGGIREALRASLGLCPRHTWGYAVVEVELWVYGTGPRGGHQPFDVCVLYGDLLATVIELLRRRRSATLPLARTLKRVGPCWICNQLEPNAEADPTRRSYAGANPLGLATEVKQLAYTTQWLHETIPVWQSRVCPTCRAEETSAPPGDPRNGIPCLIHLTQRDTPIVDIRALAEYLDNVRSRLQILGNSMRHGGQTPSLQQNASWIETLGWFASWRLPLEIVRTH